MAFTVNDLQDFTLLLNQHPEWQAEVRRLVLTSELLALPELVRDLIAAQQRTDQRFERLSVAVIDTRESQLRSEQRIGRLETAMADLAAAQARTDEKMAVLAAAQERSEQRIGRLETAMADLAAAQARTDEKMAALLAAQTRTDQKIAQLAVTQDKFTHEMIEFRRVQQQLVTDVRRLKGRDIEQRYIQYAPGYFGKLLRRVRVVWPGVLETAFDDRLDEHLTEEERADVLRLDAIIKGNLRTHSDNAEVYLALEASGLIEPNDVVLAQHRAALLRKAGLRTLPVVAGEGLAQETDEIIQKIPVVVVTNGHSEGWAETLASV